ncbi:MAG: ATP-binding protein [Opitutaceae bacterium]
MISLLVALVIFALFLGLSRYTMSLIEKQGEHLIQVNELSRDISNVVIGDRTFQDRMTGASYVEASLETTRGTLDRLQAGSNEVESQFIGVMLERVDEFSDVFRQLVTSTEFLDQLDHSVRDKVLRFSVMHLEMQKRMDAVHEELHDVDAAQVDRERQEAVEMFSLEHAKLWGWLNRAISVIDRDLIINDDLEGFNENFEISRKAYEANLVKLKMYASATEMPQVGGYLIALDELLLDLRTVAIEYTVSAKVEAEAAELLDEHGEYLRHMVDQLAEQSSEKSDRLSANLNLIFWLSVVLLLFGSIALLVWLSLSITRPLSQLASNFKEVASGNFNLQISADGKSELDDLARAFNDMTDKLRRSYGEVEDKVRQRTKELQLATVQSKKLADAAQEANLAKSAFLATMSHEIRTPLNSIIGFSEMLEDTPLDDDQREDLATIRMSGGILLDLINEILDLSKIEAGKVHMEVTPVNLSGILQEVVSLFRLNAEARGIRINVELAPDVDEPVISDRTRLQQVLNNLLSNAVKFTEKGEIFVKHWKEDHGEASGARYYFAVRDTGVGIPEDKLDEIFLAFTQADSSTTRKYGGTGLGLAISSRLVELLGGEITVESHEGSGSTFTFFIRSLVESVARVNKRHVLPHDELAFKDLPKVLIVEDDVANYTLADKILGRFGLSADWARNGIDAVDAVQSGDYDIVYMDLQMPKMDGVSAVRKFKELGLKKMPYIIALTANALEESRAACMAVGMQDFVTKPVSKEMIKASLIRFQQADAITS